MPAPAVRGRLAHPTDDLFLWADPGGLHTFATVPGTSGNDFIHEQGDGLTAPPGYNEVTGVTESSDMIDGSEGDDIIYGAGGSDFIIGGAGADQLYGGDGNDFFEVFSNSDISGLPELIDGGAGSNSLILRTDGGGIDLSFASLSNLTGLYVGSDTSQALRVSVTSEVFQQLFQIGGQSIGLGIIEIENSSRLNMLNVLINPGLKIQGSSGHDRWNIGGDFFSTTFDMDSGDDRLKLHSVDHALPNASHYLSGGDGNDHIRSDFGINLISGDAGDDGLTGGSKGDTLDGGADDDVLDGGGKGDMLTGGSGADIFRYGDVKDSRPGKSSQDIITDFSHAEGDRIDLSAIDARTGKAGDQAFHLVAGGAFTGHGGELIQFADGHGDTVVQADTNGDRIADFALLLSGAPTLVAGDFVL